jgi:plastocyanin
MFKRFSLFGIMCSAATSVGWGHGALSGAEDTCVLSVGQYQMHFTGYQPRESGNTEFCEDIPATGQTIIVLEAMDTALRDLEISIRVVDALTAEPIVEQPWRSYARGSLTLQNNFDEQGEFVGLVAVRQPGAETPEAIAEFPFRVGNQAAEYVSEPFCADSVDPRWRDAQEIDGLKIAASPVCSPDNPWFVAAVTRGTNNIGMDGIMQTRLSLDAVVKENDRDGDGDPDDIHIRLEVAELNGASPDSSEFVPGYPIAPGVRPGFWVFAPKTRGMATSGVLSYEANRLLRMPSPTIRVEQGDRVKLTLENSHYMPHTIHLHGVDHPFVKTNGGGNDGVPQTSGPMVMPGKSYTYEMTPRQTGTMAYHCHIQTGAHAIMGLFGMFVIEENRRNNWVQTLNVGAGQVRHPSKGVLRKFDREYDLHYTNADAELNNIIQTSNDPRVIAKAMNRDYRINEMVPDFYLLNGRSYPYTLRESLILVAPDEHVKLRVLNAGSGNIALHTHGHKPIITHYDGVAVPRSARITRDVVSLITAQRVDLDLFTKDDGLHNYGPGVWPLHGHDEKSITTSGMMPGGNVSLIVYESWLGNRGRPRQVEGVDLAPYFSEAYWRGELPVWQSSDPEGRFSLPSAADIAPQTEVAPSDIPSQFLTD